MKIIKKSLGVLCFAIALSLLTLRPSFAYLDPAATSYLLQVIVGVVLAIGVFAGIYRKKLILFFRNLKNKSLEKRLTKQAERNENK